MRVLVTGTWGLLGTELMRVLARNHTVIPFTRAEADLSDQKATRVALARAEPDWVVHAAALTNVDACEADPQRAMAQNAEATRHVALACRNLGILMLYLSTDYIFDGSKGAPYNEQDPTGPVNVYGASKLAGEGYVEALVPRALIVRSAWLFGLARENFLESILRRGEQEEPIKVIADQIGSPTYALDLAGKLAELIARGASGIYHITNAGAVSRYEVAQWVADRLGWPREQVVGVNRASLASRAPRPAYSALANERLASEGIAPLRTWSEAVAAYLAARAEAHGKQGEFHG